MDATENRKRETVLCKLTFNKLVGKSGASEEMSPKHRAILLDKSAACHGISPKNKAILLNKSGTSEGISPKNREVLLDKSTICKGMSPKNILLDKSGTTEGIPPKNRVILLDKSGASEEIPPKNRAILLDKNGASEEIPPKNRAILLDNSAICEGISPKNKVILLDKNGTTKEIPSKNILLDKSGTSEGISPKNREILLDKSAICEGISPKNTAILLDKSGATKEIPPKNMLLDKSGTTEEIPPKNRAILLDKSAICEGISPKNTVILLDKSGASEGIPPKYRAILPDKSVARGEIPPKNRVIVSNPNNPKYISEMGVQVAPERRDCETQTECDFDLIKYICNEDWLRQQNSPRRDHNANNDAAFALKRQFFADLKLCLVFDAEGNLPIHQAVIKKDYKAVKRNCVILRARQCDLNIPNHDNFIPLQLAMLNDTTIDIVRLLLQSGADLEPMDAEGNNIIHLAVLNNRTNVIELLVNAAKNGRINLDCFNYEGLTPLMLCCVLKQREIARVLLVYGASVNLRDQKSGKTALFHAAEAQDLEMVTLLMRNGADTKVRNFFGISPHDAMFEVDDISSDIKFAILGKELPGKAQPKRKSRADGGGGAKKRPRGKARENFYDKSCALTN